MIIKNAVKKDAKDLAYLNNIASSGIPKFLWSNMIANGESPLEVGEKRIAERKGTLTYLNTKVCEIDNNVAGMIVSYKQDNPYKTDNMSKYPELIQPFVVLESQTPGSWYINAIAIYERYRGKGIASKLMKEAEISAKLENCTLMSLIVSSENVIAKQLYKNLGYIKKDSIPTIAFPGSTISGNWILMIKHI